MSTELLERIHTDGITDPFAGRVIENPTAVCNALGSNYQYSQPIEAEVPQSFEVVEALWRNMSEQDAQFFKTWLWQEEAHATSQLSILHRLELAPEPILHKATSFVKVAGTLANATPGLGDAIEVGVLAYMALGEQETKIAYREEAGILARLGEHDLARVMGKMAHQESLHLEYQSTEAKVRYERLNRWQQRIVRTFIESQYRPVGVNKGNDQRMQGFGNMIVTVSNDNGLAIAETVQALATEIVAIKPTSKFVANKYKECVDKLRELEKNIPKKQSDDGSSPKNKAL